MPILAYHSVDPSWEHPLSVHPAQFAEQMRKVQQRTVPLATYLERWNLGRIRDEIAVTFDDGYEDNFVNALPVLAELEIPASIFVPSDLVGRLHDFGTGRPARVMSWNQLEQALTHGVSIESHSATHPDLRGRTADELRHEVMGSRSLLEQRLGLEVAFFCYPFGFHDDRARAAVRGARYQGAVVTPRQVWRTQTRLTLRRIGIYRHDTPQRFATKLSRAGQVARWLLLLARGANSRLLSGGRSSTGGSDTDGA